MHCVCALRIYQHCDVWTTSTVAYVQYMRRHTSIYWHYSVCIYYASARAHDYVCAAAVHAKHTVAYNAIVYVSYNCIILQIVEVRTCVCRLLSNSSRMLSGVRGVRGFASANDAGFIMFCSKIQSV
jgi:hypothetical protein